MFQLKSIEGIVHKIIGNNIQNFPKSIDFPFSALYKKVITTIKTIEISSECILYNSVEANNATKEFSDKSYWKENITTNEIKEYWFIGNNAQGDLWVMDKINKVYFYDHDLEEMAKENFIDFNIDFGQWLQFAYLNKELDQIIDGGKYKKNITEEYKKGLMKISKELLENYPFEI